MFFLRKDRREKENADYDYSIYDPLLGYSQNHKKAYLAGVKAIDGYEVHSENGDEQADGLRIMVLGGSTSSRLELCNWPKSLFDLAYQEKNRWEVYNGAIAGYSSAQELIKLIRDLPALNPSDVVVLSGINDAGFQWAPKFHPMVHTFQETIAKSVAQGAEAFSEYSLGPRTQITPAQLWLRNVRMMRAAAEISGARCHVFLQPVLGVGHIPTSGPDYETFVSHVLTRENPDGSPYLQNLQAFYAEICQALSEFPHNYDHVIDISDLFDAEQAIYRDSRHPDRWGNELIARKIYQTLLERVSRGGNG